MSEGKLVFKYWNGRGLMENARLMMAISGKFPAQGDYIDERHSSSPQDVDGNLGRMPCIVTETGEQIGQSGAINFFIASRCGLVGDSMTETGKILSIAEHLKEMNTVWRNLVPYGTHPTEEVLKMWFSEGASDVTKGTNAVMKDKKERYFKWFAGRIENTLDNHGFAVGHRLSLADVLIYNLLAETLAKDQRKDENVPDSGCEPFTSLAMVNEAIKDLPKIKESIVKVMENKGAQKWWAERGVQYF